jgi:hypothetical protein
MVNSPVEVAWWNKESLHHPITQTHLAEGSSFNPPKDNAFTAKYVEFKRQENTLRLGLLGKRRHRLADGIAVCLEIPATCANKRMEAERSFLFEGQWAFIRERNQLGGFVTAKHLNVP